MIVDANGDELTYWAISGLIEGDNSDPLDYTVPSPSSVAYLRATHDDRLKIWTKKIGDASFVDISTGTGYNMGPFAGTDVDFETYVEALDGITGLERVPVTIVAAVSYPAGWTA